MKSPNWMLNIGPLSQALRGSPLASSSNDGIPSFSRCHQAKSSVKRRMLSAICVEIGSAWTSAGGGRASWFVSCGAGVSTCIGAVGSARGGGAAADDEDDARPCRGGGGGLGVVARCFGKGGLGLGLGLVMGLDFDVVVCTSMSWVTWYWLMGGPSIIGGYGQCGVFCGQRIVPSRMQRTATMQPEGIRMSGRSIVVFANPCSMVVTGG